jgi:hypothetical protein
VSNQDLPYPKHKKEQWCTVDKPAEAGSILPSAQPESYRIADALSFRAGAVPGLNVSTRLKP